MQTYEVFFNRKNWLAAVWKTREKNDLELFPNTIETRFYPFYE
jgi:hypothetical protein